MTDKEKTKKAEYPINTMGYGFRSTLERGPFLINQIQYLEPEDNHTYTYCGTCAFFYGGRCAALEGAEVHPMASCALYIPMEVELRLRYEANYAQNEEYRRRLDDDWYVGKAACEKKTETVVVDVPEDLVAELAESFAETDAELEASEKSIEVVFKSMDEEKQLVYGIVLEPDEVDYHEDTITAEQIEKAAHGYALSPMVIGDGHIKQAKARPVETFVYDPEVVKEVKPGSWVMAVKVQDEDMWNAIKEGKYTGFSIGAQVRRTMITEGCDEDKK